MRKHYFLFIVLSIILSSCHNRLENKKLVTSNESMVDVECFFKEKLPLLGHRNWVIIADMAYPLQTTSGIRTVYSDKGYEQTLSTVMNIVRSAPHIYAHIYLDEEQTFLTEDLCPGITTYREMLKKEIGAEVLTYQPHEKLLNKLDSISRLYQVIVIKTPLLLPYTSVFFEFDCSYWNAEKEALIVDKRNGTLQ